MYGNLLILALEILQFSSHVGVNNALWMNFLVGSWRKIVKNCLWSSLVCFENCLHLNWLLICLGGFTPHTCYLVSLGVLDIKIHLLDQGSDRPSQPWSWIYLELPLIPKCHTLCPTFLFCTLMTTSAAWFECTMSWFGLTTYFLGAVVLTYHKSWDFHFWEVSNLK